jgi:hypothetical protein
MTDDIEKGILKSSKDGKIGLNESSQQKHHLASSARDHEASNTGSRDSMDNVESNTEEVNETRKTNTNVSSIPGQLVVVPREKRRGLLARFALIPEVEDPLTYGRRTKWILTSFVALAGAAGPTASAIFMRKCTMNCLAVGPSTDSSQRRYLNWRRILMHDQRLQI